MAETSEVSVHLVRVFRFVKAQGECWVTASAIASGADVQPRTARSHALRLVQAGIFDQAELFPGHRYRLSDKAAQRNRTFLQRLESAAEIFG